MTAQADSRLARTARMIPLAPLFGVPTVLFGAFVAVPLIALVYRAVREGGVAQQLTNAFVLDALRLSLLTSTRTLVLALLLCVPTAFIPARARFPAEHLGATRGAL